MQEPAFPFALNSTGLKEFIALAGPAIRGTYGMAITTSITPA